MNDCNRFAGKVAVVTGGTSGIGAETVRRLATEGASVLFTGRSESRGSQLVQDLGTHVSFLAIDQTDVESADLIVARARQVFGRVDVLVNNAALDHSGDLLTTPLAEVRALFEVNVFAAVTMLQAAGQAMRESGGSIVNVTSRLASFGVPTMVHYSASKGALLALTRGAAVELAPLQIRVNAVAPGMTRTALYEAWLEAQDDRAQVAAGVVASVPQGRLAEPGEIAAAISFLASDEARHVTGASLPVDGGYTAA